jgi:hypothetical protein
MGAGAAANKPPQPAPGVFFRVLRAAGAAAAAAAAAAGTDLRAGARRAAAVTGSTSRSKASQSLRDITRGTG